MMMISPRAGPVAYKHLYLMPPPEPEMHGVAMPAAI